MLVVGGRTRGRFTQVLGGILMPHPKVSKEGNQNQETLGERFIGGARDKGKKTVKK